MFFSFLLVVHFLVALALVTVILMQRSEGGGLTGGGSPAGLMSARGAADFLTRSTAILATAFVLLSITLAFLAATRHATTVDTSIKRAAPAAPTQTQPTPGGAFGGDTGNSAGANLSAPGSLGGDEKAVAPTGNKTAPTK